MGELSYAPVENKNHQKYWFSIDLPECVSLYHVRSTFAFIAKFLGYTSQNNLFTLFDSQKH